ncbi:hypothetical protein [Providencia alcalifaciens]|uniref:hypothetical protein n=1 Tax=Providencia alcalifaciens TaxID=126385 RepID=UPI0003E29063|nr:hypothetical protein [Providencia alcalifaciens]ETT00805.1 hypothetical protein HMPREF1568_1191 [Providencia alcalifaciens PAL-3]EUD00222.1 hypothetical protein HMPREF1566_2008 [Providencia alcalifaciens PAL-1]
MATLIDTLLVSLKLDSASFAADAKKATNENDRLSKSIDSLNDVLGDVNETLKGTKEQQKKAKEQTDEFAKSVNSGIKALATLFSTILVSSGLQKLIDDTAKANDQLNFMSKNLGVNTTTVKRWQGAAEMAGGSAEGMAASMGGLSKSLWDLATMGDTSVLPYFNALNVGVMKNSGELRNLDDILLDVADSLSQMSRPQAYNFAKNMGFDEGTINMLLQGRKEVEEYLTLQKDIVVSSEQELEISRQLNKQNALVGQQWEGLKTLLANYVIPYALKFSELVSGFLNYLNKNRDTAVMVFKAMGAVIGITLIPLVLKAAAAFLGMFGAIGLMPAALLLLAGGLWLLYDDFKKWQSNGKSLLADYWKAWNGTITPILKKLEEFEKWFKETEIGKWFTNQEGNLEIWKLALGGFATWFGGKWAIKILGTLTKVGAGFFRLFGLPGLLVAGAVTTFGLLIKEISDGFDKLDELLDTVGEKTGNIAKAVIALKDPNASKEDKAKAVAKASEDIIPGAGFLSLGTDGISNLWVNTLNAAKKSLNGESPSGGSFIATGVEVPSKNKRIYKTDKGDIVREGGSRSWRNNNPGNIEYGPLAKKFGAIGTDGRFAIFPTEDAGKKAKAYLLFESDIAKKLSTKGDYGEGLGYRNKKASQAIRAYAPQEENTTNSYVSQIIASVGGIDKRMGDYTSEEREKMLDTMKKVEGWRAEKEYSVNQANLINNTKSLFSSIQKPIVSGVSNDQASNFLNQNNKIQSQPQTVNNKVEANFGDININTTASTISGNLEDATQVATRQVYQMVSPMI